MATKSHKDWVSPHKVSLLILIKYLSSTDEEHEEFTDCIKRCRHKLSLLLLEFFEVQSKSSLKLWMEESLSLYFSFFEQAFFHPCKLKHLKKLHFYSCKAFSLVIRLCLKHSLYWYVLILLTAGWSWILNKLTPHRVQNWAGGGRVCLASDFCKSEGWK